MAQSNAQQQQLKAVAQHIKTAILPDVIDYVINADNEFIDYSQPIEKQLETLCDCLRDYCEEMLYEAAECHMEREI